MHHDAAIDGHFQPVSDVDCPALGNPATSYMNKCSPHGVDGVFSLRTIDSAIRTRALDLKSTKPEGEGESSLRSARSAMVGPSRFSRERPQVIRSRQQAGALMAILIVCPTESVYSMAIRTSRLDRDGANKDGGQAQASTEGLELRQ
ncbi:hypothetical protein E4U53_006495 [Claviceps sorghi]|nr:hypothetical protein E4U53_006495 [Claviceps sorghi]